MRDEVVALEGGQGSSVRAGALVLKPGADVEETEWFAGLSDRVVRDGFRLPRPIRAIDGRWVVEGWSAIEHVVGVAEPCGRWDEVLAAGRAFHAAVAAEPRPRFLADRDDRWALADDVAWEGRELLVGPRSAPLLRRLRRMSAPLDLVAQLVHGDLSGNVLLEPGLDPAVIDVSPYWRPSGYADAVVVIDALLWWDADDSLVAAALPADTSAHTWNQLLVRAAVFRLVSLDELGRSAEPAMAEQLPLYDRVVALLERRTGREGGRGHAPG